MRHDPLQPSAPNQTAPCSSLALPCLDRKPRIRLMPRRSAAALNHARPVAHLLLVQRPLARPAAGQIIQRVLRRRQRPRRGSRLLHGDGCRFRDSQSSPIAPGFRSPDRSRSAALQKSAAQYPSAPHRNHWPSPCGSRSAAPGRDCRPQTSPSAPAQRTAPRPIPHTPAACWCTTSRTKPFSASACAWRNLVVRAQPSAPVKLLQFAAPIHAKGIGNAAAIQPEDLRG